MPEYLLGDIKRFTGINIAQPIIDNPAESRRIWLHEQFKRVAFQSSNVKPHQFWWYDNKSIEIWINKVLVKKIRNIHNNPVEVGLVYKQEDYVYISAGDYSGEKGLFENVIVVNL